ncbi:MAG: PEP-CTERM sorting domain-containing protein [Acidobacteria bacterium]|nr:PEP-CTERM sorting domain-containing protein [Acidobacteriota bacterium]
MKRLVIVFTALALAMTLGARAANASSILYFNDLNVGTDRMAAALVAVSGSHTVTTAADLASFTTLLTGGGYDLAIFFQQNSSGASFDSAWTAVAAHLAAGGAAIGADWTRTDGHASAFSTAFTGTYNQGTVTVTAASLLTGITNPVSLYNPGWGVFSTDLTPGICAATFTNGDCAITFGSGTRAIFNGFLSDTFTDGATGTQLYVNEINTALGPVPEPATLTLLGLGLAGVARAARKRKK